MQAGVAFRILREEGASMRAISIVRMHSQAAHLKVHDLIARPRATNHHDDLGHKDDDKGRHRKYLSAVMEHGLQGRHSLRHRGVNPGELMQHMG